MDRRLIIAAVVVVIIVVVAVVILALQNQPGGSTGQGPTNSVNIKDFKFNPDTLTVSKGTKVTWTNNDNVQHTVTFNSGPYQSSGNLNQGDTFSVTFDQTGTFDYYCTIHPYMTAKIIVQ
jgi:amicyanin